MGEKVKLRPLTQFDAPEFSRLAGDYEVAKMLGSIPIHFTTQAAEYKIIELEAKVRRNLSFSYAITLDGNNMIGQVALYRQDEDSLLQLGVWLGRPYWGNGYGTDAVKALIREAVKYLGATRISARVFADNERAKALLAPLGFRALRTARPCFSMARLQTIMASYLMLEVADQPWLNEPFLQIILPSEQNQAIRA